MTDVDCTEVVYKIRQWSLPGAAVMPVLNVSSRVTWLDWLDFMLSQKNLWPTFTTKGALTKVITEKTFRKERRRLQAKHLWMEVKLEIAVQSVHRAGDRCTLSMCSEEPLPLLGSIS